MNNCRGSRKEDSLETWPVVFIERAVDEDMIVAPCCARGRSSQGSRRARLALRAPQQLSFEREIDDRGDPQIGSRQLAAKRHAETASMPIERGFPRAPSSSRLSREYADGIEYSSCLLPKQRKALIGLANRARKVVLADRRGFATLQHRRLAAIRRRRIGARA